MIDRAGESPGYEPVTLPEGEAWMLAPVEAGMVRYESLLDGTVDLFDLQRMNDFLNAKAENTRRAYEALKH